MLKYAKEMTLFVRHHTKSSCLAAALYAIGVQLSVAIVKEHKLFFLHILFHALNHFLIIQVYTSRSNR